MDLSEPNPIFLKLLWLPAFAAVPRHAIEAAKEPAGKQPGWSQGAWFRAGLSFCTNGCP